MTVLLSICNAVFTIFFFQKGLFIILCHNFGLPLSNITLHFGTHFIWCSSDLTKNTELWKKSYPLFFKTE